MTWHCPAWARNVSQDPIGTIDDDGETADDLYRQYRCSQFTGTIPVTADANDVIQEIDRHAGLDMAFCFEHSEREAEWDTLVDPDGDLDNVGIDHCYDCSLFFPGYTALEEHNEAEHADEDEDEPNHYTSLRHVWRVVHLPHG